MRRLLIAAMLLVPTFAWAQARIMDSDVSVTGKLTSAAPGNSDANAVVTRGATQTLTNKTLTTPTIGDFTNATHLHSGTSAGGLMYDYDTFRMMRMSPHASSTQYGGYANVSTLETWASNLVTVPGGGSATALRMYCSATAAPDNGGGTQAYAMTLRINEADTSLTCTISEAGTTCNDTTHTATSISSGDRIDFKYVPSGTPATGTGGVTCSVLLAYPMPASQP